MPCTRTEVADFDSACRNTGTRIALPGLRTLQPAIVDRFCVLSYYHASIACQNIGYTC